MHYACVMRSARAYDEGFTLAEICVAMGILVLAATGVAQLFGVATASMLAARVQSSTTVLASQKVEAFDALKWSDPGLSATPAASLDSNISGAVEYLNAQGVLVGAGTAPPASARFIRRWSIAPLPEDASNALIVKVLVTTVEVDRRTRSPRRRTAGDALVTTILTKAGR